MIVIKPHKHRFYKFKEDSTIDLETTISLSLKDSLVGFRLRLPGIDGDEIAIKEDEVIDPRTPYKLDGKGYYDKNGKRGDLYIYKNLDLMIQHKYQYESIIKEIFT